MLRTAGFESAERPNGSNVVASGEGRDPEVLDWEWSRGRDLNPRPADYETKAARDRPQLNATSPSVYGPSRRPELGYVAVIWQVFSDNTRTVG